MTEETPPYKGNKAGQGRKPRIKLKVYHKLQTAFSGADYERLTRYKVSTGRTLQDISNTAMCEYLTKQGF